MIGLLYLLFSLKCLSFVSFERLTRSLFGCVALLARARACYCRCYDAFNDDVLQILCMCVKHQSSPSVQTEPNRGSDADANGERARESVRERGEEREKE